jgi:hypothetical protein
MNIVGEGINEKIANQIAQRQKVYGSINRNNTELTYLNTRSGWCKLMSSVSIEQTTPIRNLNIPAGTQLAKNNVLFNGIISYNPDNNSFKNNQGIAFDGSIFNTGAYGLGGTEFGLRPMPGILSAEIRTETRGSIKTATVKVQANNRQQFDIIDLLYMRLGYSVLLEWGQSSYFDDKSNYIKDNPYSLMGYWFKGNCPDPNDSSKQIPLTYNSILPLIDRYRLASFGNYDAIFAKVVNFTWTVTNDGKYDITIKLISLGDVIESLKANTLLGGTQTQTTEIQEKRNSNLLERGISAVGEFFNPTSPIESFEQAHEIGKEFKLIYDLLNEKSPDAYGLTPYKVSYTDSNRNTLYSHIEYFSQTFEGGSQGYYIRFGAFLSFLKAKVIPNINNNPNIKLIDVDFNRIGNIIYTQPYTLSVDPRVCYVKKSIYVTSKGQKYDFVPGADDFIVDFNGDTNIKGKYGNIMNIYFNMEWILNKIDEIKDDKGKISLYGLLDALCKGYNESTGNFNKLEPIIDTETNTIKIVDDVALPDKDAILKSKYITDVYGNISTEEVIFDTYGYYAGTPESIYGNKVPHAGFIKDLSFTTTVSPELATMITIGSTKQGYIKGADATSLSRMNNGLTDRFKEKITNADETEETIETPKPLEVQYKAALISFDNLIIDLGTNSDKKRPIYNPDSIQDYKNLQTQLLEYYQYAEIEKNVKSDPTISSANSGFLPFDLSLKMDGLSGMKVYQKFTIDSNFLPTNYPGTLEFLIKGITHTIAGNEWTTSIESMGIPKNPFAITGSSEAERSANRGEPQEYSTTSPTSYYQSNLPPEQAKNRATLTRILDDGTQTLGILEIYDVNHVNIIYRLATVELPWKNNQNGSSCIPTGNYLVNSRQTSKYGKHFWLVGSESGQWKRIPGSNPTDRTWVLIHTAPKAPGWLAGCIGPGPQFNFKNKNTQGNPDGIGTNYLNPAKNESTAALNKLVSTLYEDKGFKIEIRNGFNVSSTALPKSINDAKIKALATDVRYQDLFKGM